MTDAAGRLRSTDRAVVACLVLGVWLLGTQRAAAQSIFTVGNYPVEARAGDPVAAKQKAMSEGEVAALRSLLKRLVPVTEYRRLSRLRTTDASRLLQGVQVRSERNSSTDYIANLDFMFNQEAVRALLEREGIAFAEQQAPKITVVPVWIAPATGPAVFSATQGSAAWTEAWRGLDLDNALAPLRVEALKLTVHADTLKALANGDGSMLRTFAAEYRAETLLVVLATPAADAKKLTVTMIGSDAVGSLSYRANYRVDRVEPSYSIELAAVVSHRILEGRWKATTVRGSGGGMVSTNAPLSGGRGEPVEFAVVFRGMGEWAEISRRLSSTPGVEDLDVAGLSQRGARVTLKYAGGLDRLADALAQRGLGLREGPNGWTLSAQ